MSTGARNPVGPVSDDVSELVAKLRADGSTVGWIVSALDRWKRVPFLLDVLDRCADRMDGFAFVALGAGDEAPLLVEAARTRPWLHPLGARFGADKAAVGELATITIHPGLAGLHVIEAFATESPMVTADIDYHSHEVSYLNNDNSVMLPAEATAEDFVGRRRPDRRSGSGWPSSGPRADTLSEVFTLDAMVSNFADGIVDALTTYRLR